MFGKMLKQNPVITFMGETAGELFPQGWDVQLDWMTRVYDQPETLEDNRYRPNSQAIGFKVKLREVASPEGMHDLIHERQLKVIYMTRANLVKQTVSSIRAMDLFEDKGVYNIRIQPDAPDVPGAYAIPPECFQEVFQWLEDAEQRLATFIQTLTVPVLKLEYAEVVNDLEGTLKQACTFLDVPPAPFVHTTRKITSDQLSDSVTNLEELRALYQGTSYEWMFK